MKLMPLFLITFLCIAFIIPIACVISGNFVLLKNGSSPDNYDSSGIYIIDLNVDGDKLTVTAEVGGCKTGAVKLIAYNYFLESLPVQAELIMDRTYYDDSCDGIWNEELQFDLTPLKMAYRNSYPDRKEDGLIKLRIHNGKSPDNYILADYKFNLDSFGCSLE